MVCIFRYLEASVGDLITAIPAVLPYIQNYFEQDKWINFYLIPTFIWILSPTC